MLVWKGEMEIKVFFSTNFHNELNRLGIVVMVTTRRITINLMLGREPKRTCRWWSKSVVPRDEARAKSTNSITC